MCQLEKRKSVQGVTVLEIMVVIAIFIIIIGASYALMSSGRMGWYVGDTKIELQEDTRRAMDVIVSELSGSVFTRVNISAGGDSITFQTPVDENGSGSREDTDNPLDGQNDFYLENTLDGSGNVRWGAYLSREDHTVDSSTLPDGLREGREVAFLIVGDELVRRVTNPTAVPPTILEDYSLADNIQNLSFIRRSNDVIAITIDASKETVDRHPINYSLSTEVHLRSSE